MDIQKKPTLAEKQAFWTEQLPNFEATYWLPSHFEFVVFDMNQGNYVIKDGLGPNFEDDATEIYHRVNTGWTMWKKAINFSRKQAQAVPEGFVLVPKDHFESLNEFKGLYKRAIINARKRKNQLNWAHVAGLGCGSGRAVELCKMLNIDPCATNMHEVIEAQELTHESK